MVTPNLFIDGEYLRQIHRQVMLDLFGVEGEVDIFEATRGAGALRAFFYDSIDDTPRPGETEDACLERIAPLQDFTHQASQYSLLCSSPHAGRPRARQF